MDFWPTIIQFLLGCLLHYGHSVELFPTNLKVEVPKPPFKECYGTGVGFAISGNLTTHYVTLRKRYQGCTYVNGNLEVTNLLSRSIEYNLDFLKDIETVTGYVLIGLITEVELISLPKLKFVRADSTYHVLGSEYGLVVTLTSRDETSGLREIHLPVLKEISRGKVLFLENPLLCYIDTIDWDDITPNKENVSDFLKNGHSENCGNCSWACESNNATRCWGPQDSLCQTVKPISCPHTCLSHCFNSDVFGCCHPECALGCTGPSDSECFMCKYFNLGNRCVPRCPDDHYYVGPDCVPLP